MAVPTIALYASPPSSLGSSPYSSSVNSHSSHDFDLNSRSTSHASSSPSTSQRQMVGGLSSLFSCRSHHPLKQPSSNYSVEDSGVLWPGRSEENNNFNSSFRHSSLSSSLKRDPSPVSALQGPLSLSGSSGVIGSCRSPPLRTARERGDAFRVGSPSGALNGIGVRNSLGSCLDYDSSALQMYGSTIELDSSSVLPDELTFSMEDGFMGTEKSLEPHVKELLVGAQLRHKIFCEESVVKAFYEAEKAHRGQMRASGDPYLQHCVETAVMLALIGVNSSVVAAGLLHDTIDDCSVSYDHIHSLFGADVANLVHGVSELSHLSKLARDSETACKTAEADRLHTVFLAMADARAVLIKLADRLHNMMTLEALPLPKQQRFAKETLEIFAPLANRLGIYKWKVELENLCFKHLNPTECEEISSKLLNSCDEAMITSASEKLEQALKDEGMNYCALSGRHKSLYSIYRKMLKKNLTLDEIHDIHGLRLIVEKEDDCFKALNVVHQLWPEVPGKLKDYIHNPKFNGYRSLHTVVLLGEEMAPLEVQIRTKEMHLQAELGIAAHWRYKEGDRAHSSFVLQMVEWARWILTWQCEEMSKDSASSAGDSDSTRPPCTFPFHSSSCPYSYKPNGDQDGPVFVILIENDKMSVREFPANSTMMDVFERAGQGSPRWTQYGFLMKEELRPRLNHKPVVDPSCKLKMGDVIELSPSIPHRSLTGYREEIQRMYEKGLSGSSFSSAANSVLLGGDKKGI